MRKISYKTASEPRPGTASSKVKYPFLFSEDDFPTNQISTTKYTPVTFVPLSLF